MSSPSMSPHFIYSQMQNYETHVPRDMSPSLVYLLLHCDFNAREFNIQQLRLPPVPADNWAGGGRR